MLYFYEVVYYYISIITMFQLQVIRMQSVTGFMKTNMLTLKQNKPWLVFSTVIFFGSTLLLGLLTSFFPQEVEQLYQAYFQELEQIGGEIFTAAPLWGTVMLLGNNFVTALLMILTGIFIGLPTFFILLINGGALGVLATILSLEGINPVPFYFFGVVPHGIFEIPAILIAGGIGLKIGSQIIRPPSGMNRRTSLKNNFFLGIQLMPAIFLLLLIAAVIEITITPVLLSQVAELQI